MLMKLQPLTRRCPGPPSRWHGAAGSAWVQWRWSLPPERCRTGPPPHSSCWTVRTTSTVCRREKKQKTDKDPNRMDNKLKHINNLKPLWWGYCTDGTESLKMIHGEWQGLIWFHLSVPGITPFSFRTGQSQAIYHRFLPSLFIWQR